MEKLCYIGLSTIEYSNVEVYLLLVSVHQGFYELKRVGRAPMKYASQAMLLQYWQPVSHPYAERDPNGQALSDMGIAFS
jgi:hypothetical protein